MVKRMSQLERAVKLVLKREAMVAKRNTPTWKSILKEDIEKEKKKASKKIYSLPRHLRGESQNKHGGYRMEKMKALKGSTFGAANDGRQLSSEEKLKIENDLRAKGILDGKKNAAQ